MARVGVIGDAHEPVTHPGYRAFCLDTFSEYGCDTVVCIGDIADWHSVSFHAHHPDCPGPTDEYEMAYACIQGWYRTFPGAKVCLGNHDERIQRLAQSSNIPARLLRDYAEIWETPGWTWDYDHSIDDVFYFHGTGTGGMHPAFNSMKKMCMSVVQGHVHTAAGVKWLANPNTRLFGMDVGCGIDDRAAAFAYGRHYKQRSVLGCGVVLDGIPHHVIMPCGPGEKYHRSRFTAKRKGK